jgi:hypothetical protein
MKYAESETDNFLDQVYSWGGNIQATEALCKSQVLSLYYFLWLSLITAQLIRKIPKFYGMLKITTVTCHWADSSGRTNLRRRSEWMWTWLVDVVYRTPVDRTQCRVYIRLRAVVLLVCYWYVKLNVIFCISKP